MASINFKTGQIRDRAKGYPAISYYVPKTSKAFMKECVNAHNLIVSLMPARSTIKPKEMRALTLKYAVLDNHGRRELMRSEIFGSSESSGAKQKSISLGELADSWMESKISSALGDKARWLVGHRRNVIMKFFSEHGLETTSDLNYGTAHKFLKWRSTANLDKNKTHAISASVMKHELQTLKQMARMASREGYMANGSLWDDVKVKAVAGVNKKVVEPLTIEEQKDLLNKLKDAHHHDIALLLLITGIRIGEMESLTKDSIQNGTMILHGNGIGNFKPMGGKTASASRTLPVCPTLDELFNRGIYSKPIEMPSGLP